MPKGGDNTTTTTQATRKATSRSSSFSRFTSLTGRGSRYGSRTAMRGLTIKGRKKKKKKDKAI
tara:strand:- start:19509 stop:19697 length:189 start_codon:yes stop_codon:yes gene_type:complete